jgi:hypothetical protein
MGKSECSYIFNHSQLGQVAALDAMVQVAPLIAGVILGGDRCISFGGVRGC